MLKARTLTVEIARPPEDVYNFLVEPANLAHWTLVQNGRPDPVAGPNTATGWPAPVAGLFASAPPCGTAC